MTANRFFCALIIACALAGAAPTSAPAHPATGEAVPHGSQQM